ncbi:MAG: hypothetical protein JRE23_08390 [Deltaproteobacteria bacterium]|nr:hypothetical protein [Deltaproteobacteria bacterium]
MKTPLVIIVLILFFVTGITIFTRIVIGQEERKKKQDILNKGDYLVSLIALHSINDFEGSKRDFFLRTLAEQTSYEGLVYCVIHDHTGNVIVSLLPDDLASQIPHDVQINSIYSMGLTQQTFKVSGSDQQFD